MTIDLPMTINPLNWTAGPFLLFYVILAVCAFAGTVLARRSVGGAGATAGERPFAVLELAWLAGGSWRASDTVLLQFLIADLASIDTKKRRILLTLRSAPLPPVIEPFRNCAEGVVTRKRFHSAVVPGLEATRRTLMNRGLVPRPEDLERLQQTTAGLLAGPVLLGIAKVIVGSSRGKPVGILVALVLLTAAIGLWSLCLSPYRTRAGRLALQRATSRFARAARAPLASEITLAFAVSGMPVLVGTPYADLSRLMPAADGGASGCGGGGGGGGGCGGCAS